MLEEIDSGALGPQDPACPIPNATLPPSYSETNYLERVPAGSSGPGRN